jgi:hypothetical protein
MLPAISAISIEDGGNVPVVVMIKKGQGNIPDTIKQMRPD